LDDGLGEARINDALPEGMRFDLVREIPRSAASLGDAISAARYRITSKDAETFAETVNEFRTRLPIEIRRQKKNGKTQTFDLAEEMLALELIDDETLGMTLAMRRDGASVKPDEVLKEIFGEASSRVDVVREELLVDWNGRLVNPLLAASASSAGP